MTVTTQNITGPKKSPYLLKLIAAFLRPKPLAKQSFKEKYQNQLAKIVFKIFEEKPVTRSDDDQTFVLMTILYLIEENKAGELRALLNEKFDLSPM